MKVMLRKWVLAVVLTLALAAVPVASAQTPHLVPGASPDQGTSWVNTMLSWWNDFWDSAFTTADSLSESSTTTSPDDDTSTEPSGETQSTPMGDGEHGPGLDPMGTP